MAGIKKKGSVWFNNLARVTQLLHRGAKVLAQPGGDTLTPVQHWVCISSWAKRRKDGGLYISERQEALVGLVVCFHHTGQENDGEARPESVSQLSTC